MASAPGGERLEAAGVLGLLDRLLGVLALGPPVEPLRERVVAEAADEEPEAAGAQPASWYASATRSVVTALISVPAPNAMTSPRIQGSVSFGMRCDEQRADAPATPARARPTAQPRARGSHLRVAARRRTRPRLARADGSPSVALARAAAGLADARQARARAARPATDWCYEPKWDGFRCIVFRDGDDVELGSRNERPLTRYFPELLEPLRDALPERAVVDGEIVIATDHGLDFDLLSQRIHPAESRVRDARRARRRRRSSPSTCSPRATTTCATEPFSRAPRAARSGSSATREPPVHLTPLTTRSGRSPREWFERFEGAGLDGVVAKRARRPYHEGKRTMLKVKHQRTADCVVAGYRVHKDGKGVGSLLLGLYDDDGRPAPRRRREQLRRRRCARSSPSELAPLEDATRSTTTRGASGPAAQSDEAGADAGRRQPLERQEGHVVGAAAHRARRRGRVRAPPGRPVPPHRPLPALAPRPRAGVVHLRAARVAGPDRAAARSSAV